ncbi:MAG: hypothetical protein H8E38_12290 [SAR324 cluster bacterium]|nr:hypothetical protein [SAR324 cluster bacterium]MBL7035252.1 hypothetical protein [SAR324 cluster bacterium]
MFKRIFALCLVAFAAYYAGANGLTFTNINEWFADNDVLQNLKAVLNKIFELAEEQQIAEKAGGVIESLKEKVSN